MTNRSYELFHGSHRITTLTGPSMGAIYGEAVREFERYRWEAKQEGRPTSPFGFRLVPTMRAPGAIHPNWKKGAADD